MKMDVRASMRQQDYESIVIMRIEDPKPPRIIPICLCIERAFCGCLAGMGEDCVHIASVAAAVESLERPVDCGVESSATSTLLWWNHKTKWRYCRFDINQPLSCVPVFQNGVKLDQNGQVKDRRPKKNMFVHGTTEGWELLLPSTKALEIASLIRNKTLSALAKREIDCPGRETVARKERGAYAPSLRCVW